MGRQMPRQPDIDWLRAQAWERMIERQKLEAAGVLEPRPKTVVNPELAARFEAEERARANPIFHKKGEGPVRQLTPEQEARKAALHERFERSERRWRSGFVVLPSTGTSS